MRRSLVHTAQRAQTGLPSLNSLSCTRHFSNASRARIRPAISRVSPQPRLSLPSIQVLAPRISDLQSFRYKFYSTEQSAKTTEPSESSSAEAEKGKEKTEEQDPVKKELEAAKKEIVDLKDKYLRSVADFRNLQDRTKRELSSARDFAISKFARDLLDSVDNLDRALTTVPEAVIKASSSSVTSSSGDATSEATEVNKDLQNLYDGLKMTETILLSTLAKHGLERLDPAANGDKFDPNIHDASFMAPMPDKPDGIVFTTVQKGFKLNGRVVRAAKVGVVKNS